jgi:thioredoxin 2
MRPEIWREDERLPVLCPGCGALNRVDARRSQEARPLCGRCHQPLEPRAPGYPIPIQDADFESQVTRAGLPVLVDFWAEWCGPCRALEPVIEQFARQNAGRVRVVKVNLDRSPYSARKYGVRAVPTLILFRGLEAGRLTGAVSLETLQAFVDRFVPRE